jgi:Metallo-beta-lactamase superfamily
VSVEVRDVAPGLWLWRAPHPDWVEGCGWEPEVSSFAVEAGGEVVLIDPLAPRPAEQDFWSRLEARPPTAVVVLKADHVRDLDLFVRWYGVKAYGPELYWPNDLPTTIPSPIYPGDVLPGGLRALHDPRRRAETPVYIAEHATLVFADGMTAPGGELRVWGTYWHEDVSMPAFRALLDLPFERVLVSHGEPVHTRADFEAALRRDPWVE